MKASVECDFPQIDLVGTEQMQGESICAATLFAACGKP